MLTWLLLMMGVLLLGWAQSRLDGGSGVGAPSTMDTGLAQDDEPTVAYQTDAAITGAADGDAVPLVKDTHTDAWASSDGAFSLSNRGAPKSPPHTFMETDEDDVSGDVANSALFCPQVNIDGTPMATCWIDIQGKPYGVSDWCDNTNHGASDDWLNGGGWHDSRW